MSTLTIRRLVLILAIGAAAGLYVGWKLRGPQPVRMETQIVHQSAGPKIEQIRQLSTLVTLHVPISDVQTSTLSGYTGGVEVVLLVKGDVDIATDLSQAEFTLVDEAAKTLCITLPLPRPHRPRLDHDGTRVYDVNRRGMWTFMPDNAAEKTLIDQSMKKAQHLLLKVADDPKLIEQARAHAQSVLSSFIEAFGWKATFEWRSDELGAAGGVHTRP